MLASDPPWQELHGNLRAFIARRVQNQADADSGARTLIDARGK